MGEGRYISCDCSTGTKCPQERIGFSPRCSIWIDERTNDARIVRVTAADWEMAVEFAGMLLRLVVERNNLPGADPVHVPRILYEFVQRNSRSKALPPRLPVESFMTGG